MQTTYKTVVATQTVEQLLAALYLVYPNCFSESPGVMSREKRIDLARAVLEMQESLLPAVKGCCATIPIPPYEVPEARLTPDEYFAELKKSLDALKASAHSPSAQGTFP